MLIILEGLTKLMFGDGDGLVGLPNTEIWGHFDQHW